MRKVNEWWCASKLWIWARLVQLAKIAGSEAGLVAREHIATAVVQALREGSMDSSYVAGTITLTNASQSYNILALIRAQVDANCPGAARAVNLYAAHANSAQVFIGAGGVTSTNYAYVLNADDMRGYDSTYQNVILGSLFAFSTSPGMKLGVEVMAM